MAQGVENAAQVGFLMTAGSLHGQGVCFGDPVGAEEMTARLRVSKCNAAAAVGARQESAPCNHGRRFDAPARYRCMLTAKAVPQRWLAEKRGLRVRFIHCQEVRGTAQCILRTVLPPSNRSRGTIVVPGARLLHGVLSMLRVVRFRGLVATRKRSGMTP